MIWIAVWLMLSGIGGLAWSWWWSRSTRPLDQWRRYRGVMHLRDPVSGELDVSQLRVKPLPRVRS